jgi:hypothetical protein
MHELLKRGGFQNLPDEALAKAVLGWRQRLVPTKRKHKVNEVVVTYHRFGQLVKEKFKYSHEQIHRFARSVDHAFPRLRQDHFLHPSHEMSRGQSRYFWRKVTVGNVILPLQLLLLQLLPAWDSNFTPWGLLQLPRIRTHKLIIES